MRSSDSRSSATTRDACLLLQVTPNQPQNCSESVFHEARSPAELVRWSLRHRRAWRSALESFWCAVAPNEDAWTREQRTRTRGSEERRVPRGGIYFLPHILRQFRGGTDPRLISLSEQEGNENSLAVARVSRPFVAPARTMATPRMVSSSQNKRQHNGEYGGW